MEEKEIKVLKQRVLSLEIFVSVLIMERYGNNNAVFEKEATPREKFMVLKALNHTAKQELEKVGTMRSGRHVPKPNDTKPFYKGLFTFGKKPV